MKAVIYARFSEVESISVANFTKVEAYWEIGKSIVEKQGNPIAEYGTSLFKELSE